MEKNCHVNTRKRMISRSINDIAVLKVKQILIIIIRRINRRVNTIFYIIMDCAFNDEPTIVVAMVDFAISAQFGLIYRKKTLS